MTLATDFRSAARNVRRGGWLSATVAAMLAVAIGAVTAMVAGVAVLGSTRGGRRPAAT